MATAVLVIILSALIITGVIVYYDETRPVGGTRPRTDP